jgi:GAF domain-containing protein
VTGEPRIRFYAGRPLKNSEGFNVGTLCLIDRVPRVLAPSELQALDDLGKWAELAMMARQPSETQAGFTAGFDEEARYDMLDARLNVWTSGAVRQLLERETMRAFHQQTPLTVVMVEIASFDDINANTARRRLMRCSRSFPGRWVVSCVPTTRSDVSATGNF